MDAVFYNAGCPATVPRKSLQVIRKITFEIGMLGKFELDINNPRRAKSCGALPPFDSKKTLVDHPLVFSFRAP